MHWMHRGVVWSCLLLCGSLCAAQVAVTTFHNDNYRSGSNTHEVSLTTASVSQQSFGRVNVFPVTGYVYAQPLYVPNLVIGGVSHNVVFIATEHDQVYAFDTRSGAQLWHTSLLRSASALTLVTPVSSDDVSCTDLVPEIGITGTPVIDTTNNTLYLIAKYKIQDLTTHTTTFHQQIHGLSLLNGVERVPPREIAATYPGTGAGSVGGILTFDPLIEAQRTGLMLLNGKVFVSWASHCDLGNYHGWLMAFSEGNLALSGVYVDTPNGYEGGFWGSGAAPAADASGSIYSTTGNGDFSASSGGTDFGDSVLRLQANSMQFTVSDYFTPWDQQTLDDNDADFGSGGTLLLPDQPGGSHPHLLIQVGKEGTIDLVNRDNMGHWQSGSDSQIVQTLPYAIGGLWSSPAFWNNTAYFGGYNDYLKAYAFNPQSQLLSTSPTSQSSEEFYYPGPTPSITSNGTNNGIVWVIQGDGTYAVLRAYTATNLGEELYNSEQNPNRDRAGLPVKFTVPTIADGQVFVGAQNQVAEYGLLQ
ncbi:MAG: pyrrolo-quinoline quinone [Candidatus Korobacteraceae bacterium]